MQQIRHCCIISTDFGSTIRVNSCRCHDGSKDGNYKEKVPHRGNHHSGCSEDYTPLCWVKARRSLPFRTRRLLNPIRCRPRIPPTSNGRLSRTSRHRPRPGTRGRKSPHGTWHAAWRAAARRGATCGWLLSHRHIMRQRTTACTCTCQHRAIARTLRKKLL